ncbi:hypothetical protein CF319_g7139 [Tilletia indica]|nr:hypothetical protein CF319_g7139 [Tilletia indica]
MPPSAALQAVCANGTYSSLEEFKHAVRYDAPQNNFNPTWEQSKTTWVVAVCEHKAASGCQLRVRAHVDKNDTDVVRVTSVQTGHVYAGKAPAKRNAYADHEFLVLLIQSCMSVDYKTKDAQVAAQLKQSFGIAIKQNTINMARNAIIGSAKLSQEAEFQYVEAWLTRVAGKDPGAIVEHHTEGGTFSRAFLCPGPARIAWGQCKPFVAVNETWTKNKFNMILLLAAGLWYRPRVKRPGTLGVVPRQASLRSTVSRPL